MPSYPNYSRLNQKLIMLKNHEKRQKIFALKKLEKEEAYEKRSKDKKIKFSTFFKSLIPSSNASIHEMKDHSVFTITNFEESKLFQLPEEISKYVIPSSMNISSISILRDKKSFIEKSFGELPLLASEPVKQTKSKKTYDIETYKNELINKNDIMFEENLIATSFSNIELECSTPINKKRLNDNDERHLGDNNLFEIFSIVKSDRGTDFNKMKNESIKSIKYFNKDNSGNNHNNSNSINLAKNSNYASQRKIGVDCPPKSETNRNSNLNIKSMSRIINKSQSDLNKNNKKTTKSKDPLRKIAPLSGKNTNDQNFVKSRSPISSNYANLKHNQTDRKLEKSVMPKTSSYLFNKPSDMIDINSYKTANRKESGVNKLKSTNSNIKTYKTGNINTINSNTAYKNSISTSKNGAKPKISSITKAVGGLSKINLSKEKDNKNKISISTTNFMTDFKSPKTVRSTASTAGKISFPTKNTENTRKNLISTSVEPSKSKDLTNVKLKFTSNNLKPASDKPAVKNVTDNKSLLAYQTSNTQSSKSKFTSRPINSTPLNKETKTFSIQLDLNLNSNSSSNNPLLISKTPLAASKTESKNIFLNQDMNGK